MLTDEKLQQYHKTASDLVDLSQRVFADADWRAAKNGYKAILELLALVAPKQEAGK